jgi:hypothetical protein
MSKRSIEEDIILSDNDDLTEFNIDENDFGFLIDGEGNLKTVFGPNDLFGEPPEAVQKILDMFGVTSAELALRSGTTLH